MDKLEAAMLKTVERGVIAMTTGEVKELFRLARLGAAVEAMGLDVSLTHIDYPVGTDKPWEAFFEGRGRWSTTIAKQGATPLEALQQMSEALQAAQKEGQS